MSEEDAYISRLTARARRLGFDASQVVRPQERRIVLQGLGFRYLDWPGGADPLLLWLHGGGQSAHTWDICCLALHRRFRCVAVDLRGHGETQWPQEPVYSLQAMGDDVVALLDALKPSSVVLIGMSMGGLVAFDVASRADPRMAGLVVIDSTPELDEAAAQNFAAFSGATSSFASLEEAVDAGLRLNPRRSRDALRRSLQLNLRHQADGRWHWKHDQRRYLQLFQKQSRDERDALRDRLTHIASPTLLVRGADSPLVRDEHVQRLKSWLPHASYVEIASSGHNVQGDNPLALISAIEAFLFRNVQAK